MAGRESLEGKVVLITGASRGIGRAVALRLACERPAHIFVGYCLNHEAAAATVSQIEALGISASAISADLGQLDSINEMFDEIEAASGVLDIFVSNAARASFHDASQITPRSWDRTMDINARAFLLGSQHAARLMGKRRGRIIAVSSLGAYRYTPGYLALGAAKAALESVARYLAVELAAQGINVNVVCGGLIETETSTLHPDYGELKRRVIDRTPAGRVGRPDDLAAVVAFLCKPEADWIRGQTLIADGGYSLVN